MRQAFTMVSLCILGVASPLYSLNATHFGQLTQAEKVQLRYVPEAEEKQKRFMEQAVSKKIFLQLKTWRASQPLIEQAIDAIEGEVGKIKELCAAFKGATSNKLKEDAIQQWFKALTKDGDLKRIHLINGWLIALIERSSGLIDLSKSDKKDPQTISAISKVKDLLSSIQGELAQFMVWGKKGVQMQRRGEITSEGIFTARGDAIKIGKENNRWKSLKSDLFRMTPEEFSGAVYWAHERNFTGKGVKVLVLETEIPITGQEAFSKKHMVVKESHKNPKNRHANKVATRILGVAPDAVCLLREEESYFLRYKEDPDYKASKIINASFATWRPTDPSILNAKIKDFVDIAQGHVFVKSFGNYHDDVKEYNAHFAELYKIPEFMENAILVVNIDRNFEVGKHSNRPQDAWEYAAQQKGAQPWTDEDKKRVMDNTICALGTKVVGLEGPEDVSTGSGTSYSAPTVSGALAILQEVGEKAEVNLEAYEMKAILLNSARQKTFIPKPGSGLSSGVFIVPQHASEDAINKLKEQQDILNQKQNAIVYQVTYERFDPAKYGKGFLDLQRMMKLAEIYIEQKKEAIERQPDQLWSKEKAAHLLQTATQTMKEWGESQRKQAATQIQKRWKDYKDIGYKKIKSTEAHNDSIDVRSTEIIPISKTFNAS